MDAARELFAECADVPMYEVARRAGVGQATLYRNFPDRRNLAAALLAEHMEQTEQLAAAHADDPDAFFVLLRNVVEIMARFHAVGELARHDACLGSELERRRQRLVELMKAPLRTAKSAGTLGGQKWNDFRKAQCGADATPAAAPTAAAPAAPAAPKEAKKEAAPAAAPAAPSGPAVFPSAVDPKYAKESAGKARMHTCVDQYNANKATGGNGGLKWIQKGGGYYSECTKKLKGAA